MSEAERLALDAVRKGVEMREAQTAYFKTRQDHAEKRERLNAAQRLEREFDRMAAAAIKASEGLAL